MLLTKIQKPSVSKNMVHRDALTAKLDEGLARKLILISAPAGFGKTSIVLDWISQGNFTTAWLSIDKNDNDPIEFILYIMEAINSVEPELKLDSKSLIQTPNQTSVISMIGLIINELVNYGKELVLVLDDYHLISNKDISEALNFFLEHLPSNLHIVIITRSDPMLPLARLRSQQQVVELRSSDLSFNTNDIYEFFNKKLKLKISLEDVETLESKTEGWIAGLQLAAISMQSSNEVSSFIKAFAGNNRYIMDYLIEEVLKIQTERVKEFLLQTSILKQLSAPLCNALLDRDDSQSLLEELEANNMFVFPLDEERKWFRFHHLFADLLKQRLQSTDQYSLPDLHVKASKWYKENSMFDKAIEHALEAKNYEISINILSEVAEEMWENGLHVAIKNYGEMLPDEWIFKSAEFSLYYSWVLITSGKMSLAEPFINNAFEIANRKLNSFDPEDLEMRALQSLLGKIYATIALKYSYEDNADRIIDNCTNALKYFTDKNSIWMIWVWYTYGQAFFVNGDLEESTKAYQKAFEYGKNSNNIYLLSTITIRMSDNEQQQGRYTSAYEKCTKFLDYLQDKGYSQLSKNDWSFAGIYSIIAVTHFMWAEIDKGLENIRIAYSLCKETDDIVQKSYIMMFYLGMLQTKGESEEVEKLSTELEEIINSSDIPKYLVYAHLSWKMYRLLQKGLVDEAQTLIECNGLGINDVKSPLNDNAYSFYARILIYKGKYNEAEKILLELEALAQEGNRQERLIDLYVIYSELYNRKNEQDKAFEYFIQALELASEENLVMFISHNLDFNNELFQEVLKRKASITKRVSLDFLNNIKKVIEQKQKMNNDFENIDISPRELDTLRLIAQDLTNQEIADKLFISLNTVKTHLKNINLKLDVENRTKAVAKAKELGLI